MPLYLHRPAYPLDGLIDNFWLIEGGQTPRRERILPGGTAELVINLAEDEVRIYEPGGRCRRYSGAVVSGPRSTVFACDAMQHRSLFGVHFKPGGAFPFLGPPANELADAHVDLDSLWGRDARRLREQMGDAGAPSTRFQLMERALRARFLHSPAMHPAIPAALGRFGASGADLSMRQVARELGLSHRRFIQLFTAHVGLTPKLFCRLLRFRRARALAGGSDPPSWAQIAVACGYYDQPHLIADFQQFSGLSPAEYLRRLRPGGRLKEDHVPLAPG